MPISGIKRKAIRKLEPVCNIINLANSFEKMMRNEFVLY